MATATRAGAEGGYAYLPVVVLAALAGYVFMEMAARVTLVSGRRLGELLQVRGRWLPYLLFGAVFFGCMAYQAGNLLGALSGLQLLLPVGRFWVLLIGAAVFALLWKGSTQLIGRVMAYIVAVMGVLFIVAAVQVAWPGVYPDPPAAPIATASLLGLLGTTIVPYNFFLAAGLGVGGELRDMRRGLLLSFGVGMLVTASIVVVGITASGFVSFEDLAGGLETFLGEYGRLVLGAGLFAAGFSSATTAPLAAAMAGRGLLATGDRSWRSAGSAFRATWLVVVVVGLLVALLGLDIVGVILAAQVINGLLLPFIAAAIFYLANRRDLLGDHVNARWQNALGGVVLLVLFYKTGEFLYGLIPSVF